MSDDNTEKVAPPAEPAVDEDKQAVRAVAFPDDHEVHEAERIRPRGPEMKREMTQEDRELAAAGYEHLEEKAKKGQEKPDLEDVDIQEHRLAFKDLGPALETAFDAKDPGQSLGLTAQEVATRLARDGHNILTPPKKKSALRKVCTVVKSTARSFANMISRD